jgi:hypothetical protein
LRSARKRATLDRMTEHLTMLALAVVLAGASSAESARVAATASFGTGQPRTATYLPRVTGGGPRPAVAGGYALAGAVGDGRADDTDAFRRSARAAATANKPLVIPPARSCYKLTGTVDLATSVLGVGYPCIQMVGASGSIRHILLRVSDYSGSGLWISGLRMDGGFDPTSMDYPSAKGHAPNSVREPPEYSIGIALYSSRNVTIRDNLIANTVGDSIYLGNDGHGPNQNILVDGNTLLNPFRCAVALIDVRNVVIINNVVAKIGTFASTVDFEPNASTEANVNVEVAFNDFTITNAPNGFPPRPTFAISNDWVVTAGGRAGPRLYLHDNVGQFGSSDIGSGKGPGFFSDNSDASSKVTGLLVQRNVSTRTFGEPTIVYFFALPQVIDAGRSVQLHWWVWGAKRTAIDAGVGTVDGNATTVTPPSTTTYTLTASDPGSATASTTVTVRSREGARRSP